MGTFKRDVWNGRPPGDASIPFFLSSGGKKFEVNIRLRMPCEASRLSRGWEALRLEVASLPAQYGHARLNGRGRKAGFGLEHDFFDHVLVDTVRLWFQHAGSAGYFNAPGDIDRLWSCAIKMNFIR
jgi:hypothetical protein